MGSPRKALLASVLVLANYAASAADFRSHSWGDTLDAVKTREGKPTSQKADLLIYTTKVAGNDATLALTFIDNELHQGMYIFDEEHPGNPGAFLDDYARMKRLLTEKYGEPEERTRWTNDLYRDDEDGWGTALVLGHLAKIARWTAGSTRVSLAIHGGNFKASHNVVYESLAHIERASEQRKKQSLDDL